MNHVYYLTGFSDITAFAKQIMSGACKAQAQIEEEREISGTLNKDQQYYFKINVVKEKNGVRITVKVVSGRVRAYYSWKVQNPNDALYDVMIDVDHDAGPKDVYIGWDSEAQKNSKDVLDPATNQTVVEAPLYGALVGAEDGSNEFRLSYKNSADFIHAGYLMSVAAVSVIFLLLL